MNTRNYSGAFICEYASLVSKKALIIKGVKLSLKDPDKKVIEK